MAWGDQAREHIEERPSSAPVREDMAQDGFNAKLAVLITKAVGSMWCAYAFALLAAISLPDALNNGRAAIVAWVAQTFLQLVLLSVIMVGQQVSGKASDRRSEMTYADAEAILQAALRLQEHLIEQDKVLSDLITKENQS